MSKTNLSKTFKNVRSGLLKRSPEILTGLGIAGMVTTTILAVKSTPKALMLIEEEKRRQNDELRKISIEMGRENFSRIDTLTPYEIVKTTWKCYVPAAITCFVSVGCLVGASSVNARRNAALATVYKLSETALSEYRDAVVETIDEEKQKIIDDKIAKNKLEKDPVSKKEVVITEKGTMLCYDSVFGRYFRSDMDEINRAITKINREVVVNMYASLNDFYSELGLSPTKIGDDLGWNIDDGEIDILFSSQIAEDGTPCIVISYNVAPSREYYKFC